MNATQFAPLMGMLLAATGHKLDDDSIEAWRLLLSDLPDVAIDRGMKRAACECKAFPSVALIREYAAEAEHGTTSTNADVWPKFLEAVRHFGYWRKDEARKAIPPTVWKALGGDVGWDHLCEMEPKERTNVAAQFRDRYRELKATEDRDRRLPEKLQPRIDNTPVRGVPEPVKALPAPETFGPMTIDGEMKEAWDRMKLGVFKEPTPPENDADLEARRAAQMRAAEALIERKAAQ